VKAVAVPDASPALDNGELALVVMLSAFVICGAFLLSGASFLSPARPAPQSLSAATPLAETRPAPATATGHPEAAAPQAPAPHSPPPVSAPPVSPPPEAPALSPPEPRLPYERDGATYFLPAAEVAAIRAEGHYTIAYTGAGRVFCPWSISEADRRLCEGSFFRVHRSYLVNTTRVAAFERRKDNGICRFEDVPNLDTVPVSRSRVAALRKRLGL
jgi:DNA-binding LytR/AlgR family response regulator